MNVTYQILKEEMDSFSYVNKLDVYYFALNHKIYSYNLITKALTVIAADISSEDYVVNKKDHYIAWQNNSNPKEATEIIILDLESGSKQKITAPTGDNINLLGKIDNNFIYGYVKHNSISEQIDGSLLVPMYKIEIADSKSQILKEYSKDGFYVSDITVKDNVITLKRVKKKEANKFEPCEADNILNTVTDKEETIGLTARAMQKTMTEYYISLPSGFKMEKKPKAYSTINTIINEDTTLRLEDSEIIVEPYTVYALGSIAGIYEQAGDAINQAYNTAGVVFNKNQQKIWERGVRSSIKGLSNIKPVYTSGGIDSIKACVQMLLNYRSGGFNSGNVKSGTVNEMLNQNIGNSVLNLTGCSLNEVLYYIDKNIPVIGMKDQDNAVLIVGYDAYNITVIDPNLHQSKKIGLNDGTAMFEQAGNLFFSYLADNK